MKAVKLIIFILLSVSIVVNIVNCSKSSAPVEPNEPTLCEIPNALSDVENNNRNVLAVYNAVIDPYLKKFQITPIERIADYHFPLSQNFPNVLKIADYGWTPNFWADIRLTHPFPGTGIDGFDPRVIVILPANPGVSFSYPVFNTFGNNKVLMENDGYTKLFDNLGGAIPGNTNPFKAYFKEQFFRVWSSTGVLSETQRWNMDINGFGGPLVFKLVVDVSTSFPSTPHPIISNAPEPVSISTVIGNGLSRNGGSAEIEVTFLDWQGPDEIKCKVEAPDLFDGAIQLFYSNPGPNPHEYVFKGQIQNSKLADVGEYNILIAAWDIPTDVHIFDEAKAIVTEDINFNPLDITPEWLNVHPLNITFTGDYAYVFGDIKGFHIFDITDPSYPIWIDCITEWGHLDGFTIYNGYAYSSKNQSILVFDISKPCSPVLVKEIVTQDPVGSPWIINGYAYTLASYDFAAWFQIVDIDPIDSAHVVRAIDLPLYPQSIDISNGYAYITYHYDGLQIIDIDPPDSAYIVNTIDIGFGQAVKTHDGYAYVTKGSMGLAIVDVYPPETAEILTIIDTPGEAQGLELLDGYAYVADGLSGLQIIDIDPPETAYILQTIDSPGYAQGFELLDGYAYVADGDCGLSIIDIDLPETAYIRKSVDLPYYASYINVFDGYGYLETGDSLQIVDLEPIDASHLVKVIDTPGFPTDVYASDGYAFVATGMIKIVDVEPLNSANVVKAVDLSDNALDIKVLGDYAYIAHYDGFTIIDINPLDSAYIVKTVETRDMARGIYVADGYAYVADSESGLLIIDIDPAESANIVKTVDLDFANGVYIENGFAYITASGLGLYIVDVDPIDSAYLLKNILTKNDSRILDVVNGYAYVGESSYLEIIDIDPLDTSSVVKTILMPSYDIWDVKVEYGYAFVAADQCGVYVVDVNPVESASIIGNIDTPDKAQAIHIVNDKAYVADNRGGLRIIDLW